MICSVFTISDMEVCQAGKVNALAVPLKNVSVKSNVGEIASNSVSKLSPSAIKLATVLVISMSFGLDKTSAIRPAGIEKIHIGSHVAVCTKAVIRVDSDIVATCHVSAKV